MTAERQIIAMGGGGFSMEPENPALDRYILSHSRAALSKLGYRPSGRIDNLDEDDPELVFVKEVN